MRLRSSPVWLVLVTCGAFLLRLPYWEVIPASFDEVNQTVFAYTMLQTGAFPLVANDAYTGPAYVYLIAALLHLGVTNPMVGRMVVLAAGTLTVPLTAVWVTALSKSRWAGLLTGGLVALNPDLILVNSHIGGATFLLPFFSTAFLCALTLAWRRDSRRWLLLAGLAGGLALQANLIGGLLIAGGLLWLLWQVRGQPRLGQRWPLWPVVTGGVILLVISPVVVFNLTSQNETVAVLQERGYLWEENPTIATTFNNLQRLTMQTIRQTAGVVGGAENWRTLLGIPLLVAGWMAAGLLYTTRRVSWLPLLVLLPYWLVLPVVSSHYGFGSVGRFTTLLVPVWSGVMGFVGGAVITRLSQTGDLRRRLWVGLAGGAALLVYLWLPFSLFDHYAAVNAAEASGGPLLELSRYAAEQNAGEPILISPIENLAFLRGVPYVPHATLLLKDIPHDFLSAPQIVGRLYADPRPRYLLLSAADAAEVGQVVPLERVAHPANAQAARRGFGLFWLDPTTAVPKPQFVVPTTALPEFTSAPVLFEQQVQLWGCTPAAEEDHLQVACYFERVGDVPEGAYMSFAQLVEPGVPGTVGQDDHLLGRERYPLPVWEAGEIVVEQYTIPLPAEVELSQLELLVGIYTWPEQVRLAVAGSAQDAVVIEWK